MELLSILSTIILVATISTFILSIGAYLLYKIRSRREQYPLRNSSGPIQAELVTASGPAEIVRIREQAESNVFPTMPDDLNNEIKKTGKSFEESSERVKKEKVSSKYIKYTTEGRTSADKERTRGDLQWR